MHGSGLGCSLIAPITIKCDSFYEWNFGNAVDSDPLDGLLDIS